MCDADIYIYINEGLAVALNNAIYSCEIKRKEGGRVWECQTDSPPRAPWQEDRHGGAIVLLPWQPSKQHNQLQPPAWLPPLLHSPFSPDCRERLGSPVVNTHSCR